MSLAAAAAVGGADLGRLAGLSLVRWRLERGAVAVPLKVEFRRALDSPRRAQLARIEVEERECRCF